MNPDILERVLSCDSLPTLPAVGVRVIELAQDPNVSMRPIAETIRHDQALAAKVLRTVNSSFFGLRKPCTSIDQAIVLLGLSAIKTLALGFSLVSSISQTNAAAGGSGGGEFDYATYWRRSLYTGIAARVIAREARLARAAGGGVSCEEECFLGGLLQDVGMVALSRALKSEYATLLLRSRGDHRELARLEMAAFEIQHPDVGALLAARWRLPDELVMPIKYHERPSAAPVAHLARVRAVALGNTAADVMMAAEPAGPLTRFLARAKEWFGIEAGRAEEILTGITAATREVSRLLQVDPGEVADAATIVRRARERLASMSLPAEADAAAVRPEERDPVTGLPLRTPFDRTLVAAFEQARAGLTPLTLAFVEIQGLEDMARTHGPDAAEGALRIAGAALAEEFRAAGGLAFRHGPTMLAVLAPRTDRVIVERAAEAARRRIVATPVEIAGPGVPKRLAVAVSAGLAWVDGVTLGKFKDVGELASFAESALRAAKLAGRNTLRVYAPAPPAAAA